MRQEGNGKSHTAGSNLRHSRRLFSLANILKYDWNCKKKRTIEEKKNS